MSTNASDAVEPHEQLTAVLAELGPRARELVLFVALKARVWELAHGPLDAMTASPSPTEEAATIAESFVERIGIAMRLHHKRPAPERVSEAERRLWLDAERASLRFRYGSLGHVAGEVLFRDVVVGPMNPKP